MANRVVADVLAPTLMRLEEFPSLEPNWDSYGADPITPLAIRIARRIAECVTASHMATGLPDLYALHAVPLAHGGVQLEWDTEGQSLEVAIGPDGRLAYLYVDERGGQPASQESECATEDVILGLASRLVEP